MPGFAFLSSLGRGRIDQQHRVPRIARDRARRALAPFRLIFLDEVERDLLHRIVVGKIGCGDDRSGRHPGILDRLAAGIDERLRDRAMGVIDAAVVALSFRVTCGSTAAVPDAPTKTASGELTNDLQRRRGHRSVGAVIALGSDDVDAFLLGAT